MIGRRPLRTGAGTFAELCVGCLRLERERRLGTSSLQLEIGDTLPYVSEIQGHLHTISEINLGEMTSRTFKDTTDTNEKVI